ncbi:uncharacterized protein A4U43_C07F26170 [Asparagus officinalis]|uniref:Uncharacterized protein n=1 Tax=Asparagus officinalis TaxID=4686 RepID=A0A5P1EEY0_ASPOF|nr:uncharacterized protein A4U43_C07F26170 [Asparagus officinalis]
MTRIEHSPPRVSCELTAPLPGRPSNAWQHGSWTQLAPWHDLSLTSLVTPPRMRTDIRDFPIILRGEEAKTAPLLLIEQAETQAPTSSRQDGK